MTTSVPRVLVILLLHACSNGTNKPDVVRTHPSEEYILGSTPSDGRIRIGTPDNRGIPAIGRNSRPVLSLGALERPAEQVFGTVSSARWDHLGKVYILDAKMTRVSVFSSEGRLVQLVGQPGQGPGEFTRLLSLAINDQGVLYVGDVANRVQLFAANSTKQLKYVKALPTDVAVDDMCFIGAELFIHGVKAEEADLIYKYSEEGELTRSFGRVYSSPNVRANMEASRGKIACNPALGHIYYASSGLLGEVRAYDSTGAHLWRVVLDGFQPIAVKASAAEFEATIPPQGYDRIAAVASNTDSIVYVTVEHVRPSPRVRGAAGGVSSTQVVAINGRSGRSLGVSPAPGRITAVSGNSLLVVTEDPFPRAMIY